MTPCLAAGCSNVTKAKAFSVAVFVPRHPPLIDTFFHSDGKDGYPTVVDVEPLIALWFMRSLNKSGISTPSQVSVVPDSVVRGRFVARDR